MNAPKRSGSNVAIAVATAMAFLLVQCTRAQLDVRSVSSFRRCVDLDPTLRGKTSGVGASLNCSKTGGGNVPPVTTLRMSLAPGMNTGSVFNVDITTVLNQEGGSNTTADSATRCSPEFPDNQLCVATRTGQMSVETSRPVFAYALRRESNFEIPYCYVSTTQFENLATEASGTPCHAGSSQPFLGRACTSITGNTQAPSDEAVMCALASMHSLSDGDTNRYQQPFPNPISTNVGASTYLRGLYKNVDGDDDDAGAYAFPFYPDQTLSVPVGAGSATKPINVGEHACRENRCQGNFYSPNVVDVKAEHLAWCCEGIGIECDSPNVDTRSPTLYPMPSPFGRGPSNLWDSQDRDEGGYVANSNIPRQTVWKSEETVYTSTRCASPNCPANTDKRRNFYVYNAQPDTSEPTRYVSTTHAILALPPTCTAYRVDPDPRVEIQVRINVTTFGSAGTNRTQTLNINNFNPKAAKSSDLKLVRASIRNIQSVDAALGPSIDGYIVVCGRESSSVVPDLIDMRYLVPRKKGVPISDVPVTTNPWPYLIQQYENDAALGGNKKRKYYFPHPFDYVKPGTRGKASDGAGLPDDFGQTFWYFVPQDIALQEWGHGCNQVGMRGSWGASPANRKTLCRLPPHACAPGIGQFVNGGQKTSVPCTVSGMFNYVSGTLEDSASDNLMQNSVFDKTLEEAKRFMPGDTFVERGPNAVNTKTSQLYTPERPNAWLANNELIFEQTGSVSGSNVINVDLVVDIVGSFVSYDNFVSKGEIIITNSTLNCQLNQSGPASLVARVRNQASPAAGVSTTYRLALDCDVKKTGIQVLTGAQNTAILAPSQTSKDLVFDVKQDGTADFQARCVFTLSSVTDAVLDPIMDQKAVGCHVKPLGVPPTFIPPNATDPPVSRPPCERSCSLCHLRNNTVGESWCWIGAGIILMLIAAMVVGTIIYAAVTTIEIQRSGGMEHKKTAHMVDEFEDEQQQAARLRATREVLDEPHGGNVDDE